MAASHQDPSVESCGVWVKSRPGAPDDFFKTEAAGLAWLAEPGVVPVVFVKEFSAQRLVLERLASVSPTREAARTFGVALARLHGAGAPAFGSLPPGAGTYYFGPLDAPMDLGVGECDAFGPFYLRERLEPLAERALERELFEAEDRELMAALRKVLPRYARDVPPARVHGDLWSGNLMWTASGVTLIDPAACGNHPFADLAMLRLFGAPHLDALEAAYAREAGLSAGWQGEVVIHQLFGLLAHVVLFGRGYLGQWRQAAADSLAFLRG